METQLVILDESNEHGLFTLGNQSNMKNFMQGKGYTANEKGIQPYVTFKGACVYITSNKLPAMSKNEDNENHNWNAIKVRCYMYQAKEPFDDKGRFPLTAPMLAHLLLDMCQEAGLVGGQHSATASDGDTEEELQGLLGKRGKPETDVLKME